MKEANRDKCVVSQNDSGLKITSLISLNGEAQPTPRPPPTKTPMRDSTPIQPTPTPKPAKAPCTLCSKLLKPRGLTQHMNMQHKCKYCSVMVENVDEHISEVHQRELCEHCSNKIEN